MTIPKSPETVRHESAEIVRAMGAVMAQALEQEQQWLPAAAIRAFARGAAEAVKKGDQDWLPSGSQSC